MKKLFLCLLLCVLFSGCSKDSVKENGPKNIDMTKMSSTMIWASFFDIMSDVDSFAGARIKIRGNFMILQGPDGEDTYNVVIADATQCCYQGIGFVYEFGGQLPEENAPITVTGSLFTETLESGVSYSYLKDCTIEL